MKILFIAILLLPCSFGIYLPIETGKITIIFYYSQYRLVKWLIAVTRVFFLFYSFNTNLTDGIGGDYDPSPDTPNQNKEANEVEQFRNEASMLLTLLVNTYDVLPYIPSLCNFI